MSSGHAINVIPDEATMGGSVRYFEKAMYPLVKERIETLAKGVA
jgi:metal-dependent amidase/aminoacylase/carboxypeptidase family protein